MSRVPTPLYKALPSIIPIAIVTTGPKRYNGNQ